MKPKPMSKSKLKQHSKKFKIGDVVGLTKRLRTYVGVIVAISKDKSIATIKFPEWKNEVYDCQLANLITVSEFGIKHYERLLGITLNVKKRT